MLVAVVLLAGACGAPSHSGMTRVVSTGTAGSADTVVHGTVASVDRTTSQLEVAVELVWRPGPRAAAETRRFTVGPGTRFVPGGATLATIRPGDAVQVAATAADRDTFTALEVSHLDLD